MLTHNPAPETLPSGDLLRELVADASLLVRRQVRLAELEGRRQLKREKAAIEWMGVGGLIAYAGVIVLLVAAALGIGAAFDGRFWLGALIIGGVLLVGAVIAGAVGYKSRVKEPLPRTRRELTKEITWARLKVTT